MQHISYWCTIFWIWDPLYRLDCAKRSHNLKCYEALAAFKHGWGFLSFSLVSVVQFVINSCEKIDNLIIELAIPDVPHVTILWFNQSRSCRDQTVIQRKRNKETCEWSGSDFSRLHVYLVLIIWLSRSKMTAGSSQQNAAGVLLIIHLYLYGSYQLTELQVRVCFSSMLYRNAAQLAITGYLHCSCC